MSDVDKPSWWRSVTPPLNWPASGGKWRGRVTLPEHLLWSGPSSTFDLDDPAELRVVYATVLREGSQDDVCEWIHQTTLLAIWDSLWLPSAVHEAWERVDSRTPRACRCLSSSNGLHRWSSRSPKPKVSPWQEVAR